MIGSREITAGVLTGAMFLASCSGESGDQQENQRTSAPAVTSMAPSPTPSGDKCFSLKVVNLLGPSKAGGENAVNKGECAGVYDQDTYRAVGIIASGETFIIKCIDGPKPSSLRVEVDGAVGNVNLEGPALEQYIKQEFPVPWCPVASPSPSAS